MKYWTQDPIHVADVEIMTKQTAAEHPEVLAHLESIIVSSNSKQRNSIEETKAVQHCDSSQETNAVQQSNQIKKKGVVSGSQLLFQKRKAGKTLGRSMHLIFYQLPNGVVKFSNIVYV